jgi:Ca-activated chloride channel family protein
LIDIRQERGILNMPCERPAGPLLWAGVLFSLTVFSVAADGPADVRSFPFSPGDTLLIQLDYGRVVIRPTPAASDLRARLIKHAADATKFRDIDIIAQRQKNRDYISVYFYQYRSETVSVEIWSPPLLNVVITGANPDVDIAGTDGYVRVQTLTGSITADDLIASTSLMTDTGDILLRARRQPQGDLRAESVSGNVVCEIKDDLNFRGWGRAGGQVRWNDEVQKGGGALERQIGLGGPLCYASSLKGRVEFRVKPDLVQTTPARTAPATPERSAETQAPPQTRTAPPPSVEASSAPAQQVPPGADTSGAYDIGYKLKIDVDWVYVNASVRERNTNRSVPNLGQDDFLLYEDGARQTITRFMQTEEPFHLLLLLDVSGSTEAYLEMIKEASIQFTREVGPEDRIAIATFNSNFQLRQDFTSDRDRAIQAIQRIRSGGGTAFYDALSESVGRYIRPIEGRKAVVVFSDGIDNQLAGDPKDGSVITFDRLYREVQEADALIYTIFLDTEDTNPAARGGGSSGGTIIDILGDILRGGRRGPGNYPGGPTRRADAVYQEARQQMEQIADQTGGRLYTPERIQDLANAYSEIAADLRIQYTLGYNSSNPDRDGRFRRLSVSIANRPDLVVRTRKGYYAKAEATKEAGNLNR